MENIIETKTFPLSTVGGIVLSPDGDILLVRSHKWNNLYSLPGGKIERGESMKEAFEREIKEETGLDICDITYALTQDSIFSKEFWKKSHFIMVNFVAKLATDQSKEDVLLNDEAQEYLWVSPQKALTLSLNQETRHLIHWLLKKVPFTSIKLRCEKLPILCSVGILPHEQGVKQEIRISIEVETAELLDYRELADLATIIAQQAHFPLIEDLAKKLTQEIRMQFGLQFVKVIVEKPSALEGAECAAVEMSVRGGL